MGDSGEESEEYVSRKRYTELLMALQTLKMRHQTTKAMLESADREKEGLAREKRQLEAALREREAAVRGYAEREDNLVFNNERLTKRVAALQRELEERAARGDGGWFGFGRKGELERLREELQVTQEDLGIKIAENVSLTMRLCDQQDDFDKLVQNFEEKSRGLRAEYAKEIEDLSLKLRVQKEQFDDIKDQLEAARESFRSLQLEMQQLKNAYVQKEHALAAENTKLSLELSGARASLDEKVPFDPYAENVFAHFNLPALWNAGDSSNPALQKALVANRSRCCGYNKLMTSFELPPQIPYGESVRLRDENAALASKNAVCVSLQKKLEDELTALQNDKAALQAMVNDYQKRVIALQAKPKDDFFAEVSAPSPAPQPLSLMDELTALDAPTTNTEDILFPEPLTATVEQTADEKKGGEEKDEDEEEEEEILFDFASADQQAVESKSTEPLLPATKHLTSYSMSVHDESTGAVTPHLGISMEDKEREVIIKEYYEGMLMQVTKKAHLVDTKFGEVQKENERFRIRLEKVEGDLEQALRDNKALQQRAENVENDLETTRAQYEDQIQAVTEHAVKTSEQMATLDKQCSNLRNTQVLCTRCQKWNYVGQLFNTNRNVTPICSHGNHVVPSFKL